MKQLTHFSTAFYNSDIAEYNQSGELVRQGLLFVEGVHTDNKKNTHEFSADRLNTIAENTNRLIEQGRRIPVLFDHNKSVVGTKGSIKGKLYTRPITEADVETLDNCPAVAKLVGKLGLFCDAVALKAKDAITSFEQNLVRTVSPGFDLANDTVRELSLVPLPAVDGLSLYSEFNEDMQDLEGMGVNTTPLTLKDAIEENNQLEEIQQGLDELYAVFVQIVTNIYSADRYQLNEVDPALLLYNAIDEYAAYLAQVLELPPVEEVEKDTKASKSNKMKGSPNSEYLRKQQEAYGKYVVPQDQKPGSNYNSYISSYLAEYGNSSKVQRYLKKVS